jgi:hypothetical protein
MLNIGLLILAAAIVVAAIILSREKPQEADVRVFVRTAVRAVEQQSKWVPELQADFAKKAKVMAILQTQFDITVEEADALIEEAVFDMHCDKGDFNAKEIIGYDVGDGYRPIRVQSANAHSEPEPNAEWS